MFAAFFASYGVLATATAGGPAGHDVFDLSNVAIETTCLLLSSFSCGMASLAGQARNRLVFTVAMLVTFALGAAFLWLEVNEFAGLIARGDGPERSAFLSAFFALVGCHGAHVTVGLLWLLTMIAQVFAKGFRAEVLRRITCFGLFWHALDIIWVALLTVVYLFGVAQ
jgi:cytochrome o ubiquinol oxidase subunit 3